MNNSWTLSTMALRRYLQDLECDAPIGMDSSLLVDNKESVTPISEELRASLGVVARPQQVIKLSKGLPENPEMEQWFYAAGDAVTCLTKIPAGFLGEALNDTQAMLQKIEDHMRLRPMPPEVHYQLILEEADFLALRDLADNWDEIPALAILEADGLESILAGDLFDAVANPEHRRRAQFMAADSRNVTKEHILYVAEGADISWLALPVNPGSTTLLVQTARAGDVSRVIQAFWRDITSP